MKFGINLIIQFLSVVVSGAATLANILPAKYAAIVPPVVGVIQAIVALLAHFANPDGTPASVPYQKS